VVNKSAREKALAYLSRFSRTELQVRRYLQRKGFSSSEITEAVAFLLEHKFLNDDSYAQSYIQSRISRLDGPLKIKQLLFQKGVPPQKAEELLKELYPVEVQIENARRLAQKRNKTREQLLRFIASRGYPGYVIRAAIKAS
jgi:regulatory protein